QAAGAWGGVDVLVNNAGRPRRPTSPTRCCGSPRRWPRARSPARSSPSAAAPPCRRGALGAKLLGGALGEAELLHLAGGGGGQVGRVDKEHVLGHLEPGQLLPAPGDELG